MIKIIAAHIEEVRGIRKLDIPLNQATFAISGPNGSGKSGVIDAIEFGLTGQIGRLTGPGTKDLSVGEHGPHVDKTKFPDVAFVTLEVYFPDLKKSAKITRKVSAPKKPVITPKDPDIKAAFDEIASHPEITLSRREILRLILVEPAKRSEEIQTILKLDAVGQTRSALNTACNRLQTALKGAEGQAESSRNTLARHLNIAEFRPEEILAAVNARRKILNLPEIAKLTAETRLDQGLMDPGKTNAEFNKQSALRDLNALLAAVPGLPEVGQKAADAILGALSGLESDPTLLSALNHRGLVERGLDLVDGPLCPLCDHPWPDEDHLREHLAAKLAKSEEAAKLQAALNTAGSDLARECARLRELLVAGYRIAAAQDHGASRSAIETWGKDLEQLRSELTKTDGLLGLKPRLSSGWAAVPKNFAETLASLISLVESKPDQTATLDAQTFLSTAQLRLDDYREAMRRKQRAESASQAAKVTYDTYCTVMETELDALYQDVQEDFSTFYRLINEGDEEKFTAKLSPSAGKLDFAVNFYERGLFPPAAFHSEGHQDGMGVCLYLALMKRLYGDSFTLALLDDVVMSVDSGHRYQFCKLLKTQFPNTQFIITTHDRLWAEQMRYAGLVSTKTSLSFHGWTVETGPLVESNIDVWQDIAASLARNKVSDAAGTLRRHLEYVARRLADSLGASPVFRSDGNYELGDLLPSVLVRLRELCGKAVEAAQSWGKTSEKEAGLERKKLLSTCNGAVNVEQWAVNKAVHYNEWANFSRKDFEPVVAAFRELLGCFRCNSCDTWLYITPRGNPDAVRCSCSRVNMNLRSKQK
ncbi:MULTISPECIES: ATP-binding protein [unclassified Bradyrhizobium]|uniref:ATP-binding protein n=1 Tax=unclassified Bradyrhizobium TaxID=2631580 RepID=UPI0028E3A159|nr:MULTISPECIES: ATP-binding protein [unclassified Bradyrhizobium]